MRRFVPVWLRALRWRLHWLRRTDAFRVAPWRSLWRLADWTVGGLFLREREFTTPDGLHFRSAPGNFTGAVLYVQGRKDPEMDRFIARRLRPGDVFVDAGANIGAYTVPAARCVGPVGRVVAFEAHPGIYGCLAHAVQRNGLGNVLALNQALGAEAGTVRIAYVSANPGETHVAARDERGVAVAMVTLDAALARLGIGAVAYLKIDVEGYESAVLAGAAGTIAASPAIVVQTELVDRHLRRYGHSAEAIRAGFAAQGLQPHRIDGSGVASPIPPNQGLPSETVWMRPATG